MKIGMYRSQIVLEKNLENLLAILDQTWPGVDIDKI